MAGAPRNERRVPDRRDPNSNWGWLIGGTVVMALLLALSIYWVAGPNLIAINTQPTTIAPQTSTVGQAPKSDERVRNPVGAPGTN